MLLRLSAGGAPSIWDSLRRTEKTNTRQLLMETRAEAASERLYQHFQEQWQEKNDFTRKPAAFHSKSNEVNKVEALSDCWRPVANIAKGWADKNKMTQSRFKKTKNKAGFLRFVWRKWIWVANQTSLKLPKGWDSPEEITNTMPRPLASSSLHMILLKIAKK